MQLRVLSFVKKERKKEGKAREREQARKGRGMMQEEGRRGGVGGIVSPSGPQKSVAELEGLFVFN